MQKIAERLYLAQCCECQPLSVGRYVYIYCCHWPCGNKPGGMLENAVCSKNVHENMGGVQHTFFFELENMEIPRYRVSEFVYYLNLLDTLLVNHEVIIASEKAESRAPSLALLWMTFRGKLISRSSFAAARSDFTRIYPHYTPWPGWVIFFEQEWDAFKENNG